MSLGQPPAVGMVSHAGFRPTGLRRKPGKPKPLQQKKLPVTRTTVINRFGLEEEVDVTPAGFVTVNKGDSSPARHTTSREHSVSEASTTVPSGTILDGFVLLEASHVEDPLLAAKARLVGRDLVEIAEEDMQLFPNLTYLDVGDNHIPFYQAAAFPNLETLLMPCNRIVELEVPKKSFLHVQVLDLAYNKLSLFALATLRHLPQLRVLDLTGNELSDVPADMSGFSELEKLDLDVNNLADPRVMHGLATIPKLKDLNLAKNKLQFLPDLEAGFDALEILNLSDNRLEFEEDALPLVHLPALKEVQLWGNPLVVKQRGVPRALGALLADRGATLHKDKPKPQPRRLELNRKLIAAVAPRPIKRKPSKLRIPTESETETPRSDDVQKSTVDALLAEHGLTEMAGRGLKPDEDSVDSGGFFITQGDQYADVVEGRASPEMLPTVATAAPFPETATHAHFGNRKRPPNAKEVQNAMHKLRYALDHPVPDAALDKKDRHNYARPTKTFEMRKKESMHATKVRQERLGSAPRRLRKAEALPTRPASRDSSDEDSDDVEALEGLLAQMKSRLSVVESNLATVLSKDSTGEAATVAKQLEVDAQERYDFAYRAALSEDNGTSPPPIPSP